jgi:hypothetical protein
MARKEFSVDGVMAEIFYSNVDPRRKQERNDARLVSEDHRAMANLSNTPVYHEWNPDKSVEHLKMYDQDNR